MAYPENESSGALESSRAPSVNRDGEVGAVQLERIKERSSQKIGNRGVRLLRRTQEALGLYVYVLVDPRAEEIFYVGKGGAATEKGNERVLSHFYEARKYARGTKEKAPSAKTKRILDIWSDGHDVSWWIVRRGIKDQSICNQIEAALIDVLSLTPKKTLNAVRGYGSKESGLISSKDVLLLNPPKVRPKNPYETVFLFPINQLLGERRDLYEATRQYWNVTEKWREAPNAIALGINSMTSAAAFLVERWRPARGKFAFTGQEVTDAHELAKCDFSEVINTVKGYWQRGQFLIVEFDGRGRFRFHRGCPDKAWLSL